MVIIVVMILVKFNHHDNDKDIIDIKQSTISKKQHAKKQETTTRNKAPRILSKTSRGGWAPPCYLAWTAALPPEPPSPHSQNTKPWIKDDK